MNDTYDDLEAQLRDVLAHQAAVIDESIHPLAVADGMVVAPLSDATDDVDELVSARRRRSRRMFVAAASMVAAAAAIAIFFAAVEPSQAPSDQGDRLRVSAALGATVRSGSFEADYVIEETMPTKLGGPKITGTAVVVLEPFGIESVSSAPTVGDVTLYANDNEVVLLAPDEKPYQRSPLPAFATTAEESLRAREASVVMLSLASPTGYLTLSDVGARNAASVGRATVDGVTVAEYEVRLSPDMMRLVAGTTPAQRQTIDAALSRWRGEGYTGTTMRIGVSDDNYIRSLRSIAHFADGGSVTLSATFSKFGCAGPVRVPGSETPATVLACQ
jgi:hypothetical protein